MPAQPRSDASYVPEQAQVEEQIVPQSRDPGHARQQTQSLAQQQSQQQLLLLTQLQQTSSDAAAASAQPQLGGAHAPEQAWELAAAQLPAPAHAVHLQMQHPALQQPQQQTLPQAAHTDATAAGGEKRGRGRGMAKRGFPNLGRIRFRAPQPPSRQTAQPPSRPSTPQSQPTTQPQWRAATPLPLPPSQPPSRPDWFLALAQPPQSMQPPSRPSMSQSQPTTQPPSRPDWDLLLTQPPQSMQPSTSRPLTPLPRWAPTQPPQAPTQPPTRTPKTTTRAPPAPPQSPQPPQPPQPPRAPPAPTQPPQTTPSGRRRATSLDEDPKLVACHVQPVLVVQKSHGGEHLRVTGRAPGARAALAHDGGRRRRRQGSILLWQ